MTLRVEDRAPSRPPATPAVWATTLVAVLLVVPAAYAALRARDVLFGSEPNPATVIWSARIAMYWRLAISSYLAGMVAPLAYFAARGDLDRTVRAVSLLAPAVATALLLQGLLLP